MNRLCPAALRFNKPVALQLPKDSTNRRPSVDKMLCPRVSLNEKLESALGRTIELLENCKHLDKAVWFRDHLDRLRDEGSQPSEIRKTAEAIRSVLAGMGSFSDISLVPSTESGLSIRDAHQLQWALVEELDSVTEEILR